MIGCFPTPYNDELIYSILSRYHLISSNESEHLTFNEFFSKAMREIKMDLFPYAKRLEMKLGHFNFYNAIEIIENFSFFNYYSKFSKNKSKFQSLMLDERAGRIKSELYCHDIEIYNADYYKFCLKCFDEDSENGVPYWHITHNLPGVTFCEQHNCKLVVSDVIFNGKKLIALSSQVKISVPPLLSDKEEKILKLITEQTVYLFYTKKFNIEYITPYISYIYNLGYLTEFYINEKRLKEDFINFYSDNVCKMLHVDNEYVISKIIGIISDSTKEIHPLFHILFIIFCGMKISDLSKSNSLSTPFDSSLLDINVCKCYEGSFIHNSSLRFRSKVLFGSYKCLSCGNIYDIDSRDKKLSVRYGKGFSEKVIELLFIGDLSISEICSKLNTSKTELKNYLIPKSSYH